MAKKISTLNTEMIDVKNIIPNKDNPRVIKDDKFKQLVQSIKDFPEMLQLRPLVVDENMTILGGNMRFKALCEAGHTIVPVLKIDTLTEQQKKEFIIKDNIGFGEWDWDMLANEWDSELLGDWGLDVWQAPVEVDYDILDGEDLADEIGEMADGVKRAIQIEFEAEHYEEAQALVKYWRDKGAYLGGIIMECLKAEKDKE